MRTKRNLTIILVILNFVIIYGFNTDIVLKGEYKEGEINDIIKFDMQHINEDFEFKLDLSFNGDKKYISSQEEFFFEHYFMVNQAYIGFRQSDKLKFKLGRFIQEDEINSPYSLFFSSNELSSMSYKIDYEDETFFYKGIWVGLNKDSAYGYPDRGLAYKLYGLKLGKYYRFGYQDGVVYVDRYFDSEYFFNPIPAFFQQEWKNSTAGPWKRDNNENSIMGFFIDRKKGKNYTYFQVLVDDWNGNRFYDPDSLHQNPDKVAISIGGKSPYKSGILGIYSAAATKYTYEPSGESGDNSKYGYTYYPDTEYVDNEIFYEDNYIGYKYGENNLFFQIDYEKGRFYNLLELGLSGNKSPANAWHEYLTWSEGGLGYKFLDGDLEKTIKFGSEYSNKDYKFGMKFGKRWNVLELTEAGEEKEDSKKIYKTSNKDESFFELIFEKKFDFIKFN